MIALAVVVSLAGALASAADAPDAPAPGDTPAPVDAPAPVAPAPVPPAPAHPRLARVVVQDVVVDAGIDGATRLRAIFTSALVSEVRKLDGVSVVGLDEVRALLDHEADKQLVGCDEKGCLAEIADAIGADVVVTARLSTIAGSHVLAVRRLDAVTAMVSGVDRRFDADNGEEFLAAVGPVVAELFPDHALAKGKTRGVPQELALRLNPPPLPPWAFFTTVGVGAGVLAVGAVAGVTSNVLTASVQQRIDASVAQETAGRPLKSDFDVAVGAADAANALFIAGGACAIAAGTMALFTDFRGYGEATP